MHARSGSIALLLALLAPLALLACSKSSAPGADGTARSAAPPGPSAPAPASASASAPEPFALSSTALLEGDRVPGPFACADYDHLGSSPPLAWTQGPEGTVAYALTMIDPDAKGFVHWAVTGLPRETTSLPAGVSRGGGLPKGAVELPNDFDKPGYGGPCPPPGAPHHYVIELWALRQPVLAERADKAFFTALEGKALARSKLTVTFSR
jgi:Raf kinase inhibitor-like YbhB/YbcL family protein